MPARPSKKDLAEAARERETFRYDASLIAATVHNNPSNLIPPSKLRSCADPALTAFAQLGALRMGASRAMISLFDTKHQYVIAEATPTLPLAPSSSFTESGDGQKLWLCGTALPRGFSLCEEVLVGPHSRGHRLSSESRDGLPVSVIPDLDTDPRAAQKAHHKEWPRPRFYAGVPIQSQRGINIGVFCVYADEPRQELDLTSIHLMRGLSKTITDHLDATRTGERHRRAVRMVRGIGSFVEGKATMSGWKSGSSADSFSSDPSVEGALNRKQQRIQDDESGMPSREDFSDTPSSAPSPCATQCATPRREPSSRRHRNLEIDDPPSASDTSTNSAKSLNSVSSESTETLTGEEIHSREVRHVFSKASNIIRESIEVEGAIFLDASIGSFAGLATKVTAKPVPTESAGSSSSSDEKTSQTHETSTAVSGGSDVRCRILGHSNSVSSSVDRRSGSRNHPGFSERFLAKLLRRYPEGKIFAFDENGSLQSSDYSDDDSATATPLSPTDQDQRSSPRLSDRSRKRNKQLLSRQNEGRMIMSLFSGARSVALVPIWDTQKQRWFAGGFVYTKTPTRVMTMEGELSYLRAFGAVIMAEVSRVNARMVDKAKSDLLSSLSHELRSPLHGILLGAELLHDTTMDAFQGDVLHSVETCGHTLLDTIDHLLDWSKINNFLRPTAGTQDHNSDVAQRGLRSSDKQLTIEAGMMSLTSNVGIDVLAEEVIESVCAGFSFQRFAVAQLAGNRPSEHADTYVLRRLDSMQALENMASEKNRAGDAQLLLGDVAVTFDINPAMSWTFHTQPGALRRIIMNLLGNSLKYTDKGFVNVHVLQVDSTDTRRPGAREVHFIIADSGRGMSEDYLRHHLFSPFYQEDTLSAGTGLGLSLIKEVVTRLGGSIQVQSRIGEGTRVTVKLPLQQAAAASPKTSIPKAINFDDFRAQVSELKGLRARLLGFATDHGVTSDSELSNKTLSESVLISNICREWLQMQVVDESFEEKIIPDLVLSTERYLDRLLFERRHGLVSTPVVVVCRNALIARQLATSPRFTGNRVIFEFVSQPIGPRKLARILLLSFRRWTKLQASAIRTPTVFSLASLDHPSAGYSMPLHEASSNTATSTEGVAERTEYFDASDVMPEDHKPQDGLAERPLANTLPSRPRLSPQNPMPSQPEINNNDDNETGANLFLLVEDNHINLKILESYMKKLGHQYRLATDGQKAVDAFDKDAGRYKCIFMDISMPNMDGFEATREIRVIETKKNLPRCQIFALTGLASASAQEEAFASGIDLFLTKPVKLKELSKILETRDVTR
ncbi:Hybrid signal transduction histidine kinase L [Colletotrichum trifolii]|uniref:Hybrid signal transduction histidine kinase L n=1 Tax=Colletotrichum trifolii TaxID=5466 RepID=A0A4R8RQ65_COLTR|nr:Hybrid signal transduction histidine kinase L [Colletotrichum trifolii]